jgi:hypothetical protein
MNNTNEMYYNKYIKYKQKYCRLKRLQTNKLHGGSINNIYKLLNHNYKLENYNYDYDKKQKEQNIKKINFTPISYIEPLVGKEFINSLENINCKTYHINSNNYIFTENEIDILSKSKNYENTILYYWHKHKDNLTKAPEFVRLILELKLVPSHMSYLLSKDISDKLQKFVESGELINIIEIETQLRNLENYIEIELDNLNKQQIQDGGVFGNYFDTCFKTIGENALDMVTACVRTIEENINSAVTQCQHVASSVASSVASTVSSAAASATACAKNLTDQVVSGVTTKYNELKIKIENYSIERIKSEINKLITDIINLLKEINKLINDNIKDAIKLIFFSKKYEKEITIWNYLTVLLEFMLCLFNNFGKKLNEQIKNLFNWYIGLFEIIGKIKDVSQCIEKITETKHTILKLCNIDTIKEEIKKYLDDCPISFQLLNDMFSTKSSDTCLSFNDIMKAYDKINYVKNYSHSHTHTRTRIKISDFLKKNKGEYFIPPSVLLFLSIKLNNEGINKKDNLYIVYTDDIPIFIREVY